MRCIFCKNFSDSSRSVEHIIPESLGNTKQILPRGVVCDKCNNYFARKVEKLFLDASGITELRSFQFIPNKKGIIPSSTGYINAEHPVQIFPHKKGEIKASIAVETELFNKILDGKGSFPVLPTGRLPEEKNIVSRFLAKIAVEAIAQRFLSVGIELEPLTDGTEFDPIRDYARLGRPNDWEYHKRTYEANQKRTKHIEEPYKVIYEYDLFYTPHQELYFILVVFGLELTINVGGPDIDGYLAWLAENNNVSPLYIGKNKDLV
jgi:hypothetical protein